VNGKIEQVGTPHQLYFAPVNQFVATFIGAPQMNLINCDSAIRNDAKTTIVRFGDAPETTLPIGDLEWADGNLTLGFRPEHVLLKEPDGEAIKLRLRTDVVEHLGAVTNIYGQISVQVPIIPTSLSQATRRFLFKKVKKSTFGCPLVIVTYSPLMANHSNATLFLRLGNTGAFDRSTCLREESFN
jgi:ABC-type sugar transport system ATPase subunit